MSLSVIAFLSLSAPFSLFNLFIHLFIHSFIQGAETGDAEQTVHRPRESLPESSGQDIRRLS